MQREPSGSWPLLFSPVRSIYLWGSSWYLQWFLSYAQDEQNQTAGRTDKWTSWFQYTPHPLQLPCAGVVTIIGSLKAEIQGFFFLGKWKQLQVHLFLYGTFIKVGIKERIQCRMNKGQRWPCITHLSIIVLYI